VSLPIQKKKVETDLGGRSFGESFWVGWGFGVKKGSLGMVVRPLPLVSSHFLTGGGGGTFQQIAEQEGINTGSGKDVVAWFPRIIWTYPNLSGLPIARKGWSLGRWAPRVADLMPKRAGQPNLKGSFDLNDTVKRI